jgi:hypothetical protein
MDERRNIRSRFDSYLSLVLILLVGSCGLPAATFASPWNQAASSRSTVGPVEPPKRITTSALRGGVLATFDVHGEVFHAWVINAEAIDALFALREGNSTATIPIGRVRRGPGQAAYNAPWRWHFDPEQFAFADATIELCDAMPSFVDENLRYFSKTVRTYCPWGAVLVDVRDFR